jgi:hypothetical protein
MTKVNNQSSVWEGRVRTFEVRSELNSLLWIAVPDEHTKAKLTRRKSCRSGGAASTHDQCNACFRRVLPRAPPLKRRLDWVQYAEIVSVFSHQLVS